MPMNTRVTALVPWKTLKIQDNHAKDNCKHNSKPERMSIIAYNFEFRETFSFECMLFPYLSTSM